MGYSDNIRVVFFLEDDAAAAGGAGGAGSTCDQEAAAPTWNVFVSLHGRRGVKATCRLQ